MKSEMKFSFVLLISIIFLTACSKEEISILPITELHGEYTGTAEKFIITPLNVNDPNLNTPKRENYKIRISEAASSNTQLRITPVGSNFSSSFNANADMIFSGGLINIPNQAQGTSNISSTDGGLYIHNSKRLRFTIRVVKGDSTFLEIFEGVK